MHANYGNKNTFCLVSPVYHVTDDDLESSVLLIRHMQSGHGNEYMESFGLFNSIPFESLCARIFSICRLKLFHLEIPTPKWIEKTNKVKM